MLLRIEFIKISFLSVFLFFVLGFIISVFTQHLGWAESRVVSSVSLFSSIFISFYIVLNGDLRKFYLYSGLDVWCWLGFVKIFVIFCIICFASSFYIIWQCSGNIGLDSIIFFVILAPIAEEIFYRRIVFESFSGFKMLGVAGASVISSVIFSISHLGGGYSSFLFYFLFGMFFALAKILSGIKCSILFHSVFNLLILYCFYNN